MATKLVTLKKKNGDVYYPKTSTAQVDGLTAALAAKVDMTTLGSYSTTTQMNQAIADGQVFRDTIKVADTSNQSNWATEDEYLVGNDTNGYIIWRYVFTDETKTSGAWTEMGSATDISLDGYLTEDDASTTYATQAAVAALGTVYIVANGTDLSAYGDEDLIVELDA